MSEFEIVSVIFSVLTVLVIPLLVLVVRSSVRWARMEDKLIEVAEDMKQLVQDKDKTHDLIYRQMKDDREATNKRLTWLEQNLWRRSTGGTERNR